jgi:ACT domain-containing protein
MKAVITVIGKDTVGIIAKISNRCYEYNVNIIDITQKVLDDMFVMIMMVEINNLPIKFTEFVDEMSGLGKSLNLEIHTMHEDLFNTMHKI